MSYRVTLGLTILALSAISCDSGRQSKVFDDAKLQTELRRLEHADAAKELAEALRANDTRFIGVMGFALEVPGFKSPADPVVQANGLRIIEGTSDVITSAEHARLQKIAREYAQRYNQLLLKQLSGPKPTERP